MVAIRDVGATALVEVLKSPSCQIVEMNLGCNEIWEDGGKAIGEVLRVNKSV